MAKNLFGKARKLGNAYGYVYLRDIPGAYAALDKAVAKMRREANVSCAGERMAYGDPFGG